MAKPREPGIMDFIIQMLRMKGTEPSNMQAEMAAQQAPLPNPMQNPDVPVGPQPMMQSRQRTMQ